MADNWQQDLAKLFTDIEGQRSRLAEAALLEQEQARGKAEKIAAQRVKAEQFIRGTIEPLLEDLAGELRRHGRTVTTGGEGLERWIESACEHGEQFRYELVCDPGPKMVALCRRAPVNRLDGSVAMWPVQLRKSIAAVTRAELAADFIQEYRRRIWETCFPQTNR